MFETIIHTVPYAVGVCVCGSLAAYAALKVLGRLNGYSIGISIDPVDMDLDEDLDREYRIPRLRSGDERRAARKLAEAKSRARTRQFLQQAKTLDSEVQRQYEDARAKREAAWSVKNMQDARMEADGKMREAVRVAEERRKYREARVAELDAIRAERKAAAQSTEQQQTEEANPDGEKA